MRRRKFQLLCASTRPDQFKLFVEAMGTPALFCERTTTCASPGRGWIRSDAECELHLPAFSATECEQDPEGSAGDALLLGLRYTTSGNFEDTKVDLRAVSHLEAAEGCTIKLYERIGRHGISRDVGCHCCAEKCKVHKFIMPSTEEQYGWFAAVLERMVCEEQIDDIGKKAAEERAKRSWRREGNVSGWLLSDEGKGMFQMAFC